MNHHRPAPALQILQGETHVLQPGFIEEIKVAVRQSSVDQRGSGVDDKTQVRALLWQGRTRYAGRHSAHYILFGVFRTPDRDDAWDGRRLGNILRPVAAPAADCTPIPPSADNLNVFRSSSAVRVG